MHTITNFDALARTTARRDALTILEAGLAAIDTATVIRRQIQLDGTMLRIGKMQWDLTAYAHLHVIGFGKASCAAAATLDELLGDRITYGIALGTEAKTCRTIDVCEATHPLPSPRNVELTERLVRQCEAIGPHDLVLVVVSGGGSAMLCWPASECEQSKKLYAASLSAGLSIHELNTVRKHLSALKGGGLVKLLGGATVVGLIFSDVPGGYPDTVASGPTYLDTTTAADAQAIIKKFDLGQFDLTETPKDVAMFANVTNIVLVDNITALDAMAGAAHTAGYDAILAGNDLTETPADLVAKIQARAHPHTAVIAGGEPRIAITTEHGRGGRNRYTALTAVSLLYPGQAFVAYASDGMDNGPEAGAVVDAETLQRARTAGLDIADHLARFDDGPLLEQTNDVIMTGPTGANVSDLFVLVTE